MSEQKKYNRTKKPVNIYLNPKLYEALNLYCQDNNVLKTELVALLLMKFFNDVERLSNEVKTLINDVNGEDLLSKFSPYKSETLNVPELFDIWEKIVIQEFGNVPSSMIRLLIENPDMGEKSDEMIQKDDS
jgi:hypothetical protein